MLKALFPWKHNKTKVMAAEQTMDNDATLQPQDFFPCHVCGRTFLLKPLKRHEKVCEKNAAKKRRVFDSLKQRVEGTDLAPFHQKVYLKKPQETTSPPKPPSKWKEKHLELVNAIRAAKGVVSDPSSTSLSTKKSTNAFMAGNERCPSCERQFGPKAFDRHVEWCKERKTRIQHSPANVLLAKERLEARTKYKVPPLNKSKRTITKEKYSNSPSSDTKITTRTTPSTPILQRGPSIRKPKSLVTLGKIGDQIEEKYQIKEKRTGRENQKEVVPALPLLKSTETSHYDPIETAQRQFMELLECDDFKPFTSNTAKILHTPRPNTTSKVPPKKSSPSLSKKSIKSASPPNNKRSSIIDPPISFKDSTESFEDDFELLENLINENYTDDNKITTISEDFLLNLKDKFDNNNVGNNDDNNSLINLEQIFRSSNNRKYSDDSTIIIDPSLINENDNLSIPEHFHSSASPTSTIDTDITIQNDDDIDGFNPIDLSTSYHHQFETKKTTDNAQKPVIKRSISLSSRTKIDKEKSPPKLIRSISSKSSNSNLNRISKKAITKSTTKSINKSIDCSVVGSNGNRNDEKKKSMSPSMKTLFVPPSPKPPSMKNRHDIINYLTEQDTKNSAKSDGDHEVNLKKESSYIEEPLKPEDLFHVDDEMYEEYKKYEEMYLKEMEEKKITKKHRQKTETNYGLLTASEEDETNKLNKIANDSAYGSLNRKTQKRRGKTSKLSPLEQKNSIDSTSSSGSENNPGSPAIITSHQEQNQRLSKFCHECGNKYPLTTAKFCVECGVRRLVL